MEGVTALVIGAIAVIVTIAIGAYVIGTLEPTIAVNSLDTQAQQAINQTFDNSYSGFKLGSIIPIVLFAGIIIGAIGLGLGLRR